MRRSLVYALASLPLLGGCSGDPGASWDLETASFALVSNRDGDSEIYLREGLSDTTWTRLTESPGLDNWPTWSSDGARIAFHSSRAGSGNLDIYVLEIATGMLSRITDAPEPEYLPDWSPDGLRILYLSRHREPGDPEGVYGHIWSMAPDGSAKTRLTREPIGGSLPPRWSPDGRTIAFARQADGATSLHLMDAEGGNERTLLEADGYFNYPPAWSPDGQRLAYTSAREEAAIIIVMQSDGTDPRTLVGEAHNYGPVWSPDGRWIAYARQDVESGEVRLMAVPSDGSASPRPIGGPASREEKVAWRPGG